MHRNFITISALPDSEMFVIQFKAHGLYPFIQVPINCLNDKITSTEEYFGEVIHHFRQSLLDKTTPEEKFQHCEDWISSYFSIDHLPEKAVLSVYNKIKTDPSLEFNTISSLIDKTGISKKHFTHLFKKYLGLTPKQFQRVIRFNEILASIHKKGKVEWVQIALNCGYYDQAHFIKEFKLFCGINPTDFISNYKDYDHTNFFPLD